MNTALALIAALMPELPARVLEPVIVLAERREVAARDVPLSVNIVSAQEFEDRPLERLADLASALPAVQFKSISGSSAPQIYVRGIGNTDVNPSANPGVAIYLGDTLVSSPLGQGLMLFDLECAELLKGPQGTLFGRNATGGALVLVPRRPSATRGGALSLAGGTDGYRSLSGALDTGEFDAGRAGSVRLRLAGIARASDGTTTNTLGPAANELDEHAVRLTLEADLDARWTASLRADTAADRSTMTAHEGRGLYDPVALAASAPGAPRFVPCAPAQILASTCANALGYVYSADPYSEGYDQPGREDLDAVGITLALERTGPVSFRTISSWRSARRDVLQDADASPLSIAELGFENAQDTWTQEFLLDGQSGRLDWRAGVFGLSESLDTTNRYNTLQTLRDAGVPFIPDPSLFFLGPFRLAQTYRQEITSAAVFADADYALTSRLTATAGLRLTRENTRFETETLFREVIADPILSPTREGEVETGEASWRLALNYRVSDPISAHASVSRGFKSANFNGGALFPVDDIGPVDPERLTAWEAGLKADLSQGVRTELSLYAYDYEGLQTFTFRPVPPPTRQVLDSGDAQVLGLDASLTALLPLGLEGRVALTWLDAHFTDFVDANGVDRSGNPLPNAPDLALNLGLTGRAGLSPQWDLLYAVSLDHRSAVSFDTTDNPLLASDAATRIDARIALARPVSGLTMSLEARNLADTAVLVETLNIAEYGLIQQTYAPPRQLILRLDTRF